MAKTDAPPVGLHQRLRYDPDTGLFHYLVKTQAHGGVRMPGDVAGSPKDGYVNIGLNGTLYRAHRLAWYVMTGDWLPRTQDVDHKDEDPSNNRWANLRLATRSQNNHNRSKPQVRNKSGHPGVSWRADTKKWHARVYVNKRAILLGDYVRLEDAIAARKAAETQYFGAFAPGHEGPPV